MTLLKGLFLAEASCTTGWVGLAAQTPEGSLVPPVRLVSASYYLCRPYRSLDGSRNDIASFRLFGATRNSATPKFHSEYLPGLPPSTSLVADPSRKQYLCQFRQL